MSYSPETSTAPLPDEKQSDKKLMKSFVVANLADSVSTIYGIKFLGFEEINSWAAEFFENGTEAHILATKLAIISVMVILYALSSESKSRFLFSVKHAIRIDTFIVWAIVVFNVGQIGLHVVM